MATALEGELVRVVKTLEELQHKYLGLLEAEGEAGAEEAEAALRDYRLLTDKMLDWIVQCDNVTRCAPLSLMGFYFKHKIIGINLRVVVSRKSHSPTR